MSMNNVFTGNPYGMYANGMTYAPQRDLVWTNPLTPEEEKTLNTGSSSLSLDIPSEEMIRCKCTHRDPVTKQFTVRPNTDGTHTCLKCGATFKIVDNIPPEDIEKYIGGVIDILQTIKMAYIDMTPEVVQTYFVILPFLNLAPKLYDAAVKTLNNVIPSNGMVPNGMSGNVFYNLNSAVGTMQPMQQPMMTMPQGPMAFQNMGVPQGQVPYNMNPMYAASQPMNMPQMPSATYQPTMQQPPQQPAPDQAQAQQPPKEGEPVKTERQFSLN